MGNHAIVPLFRASQTAPLRCSAVTVGPLVIPAMSQKNIMAKVQYVDAANGVNGPEDMSSYTGYAAPLAYTGLLVAHTQPL